MFGRIIDLFLVVSGSAITSLVLTGIASFGVGYFYQTGSEWFALALISCFVFSLISIIILLTCD